MSKKKQSQPIRRGDAYYIEQHFGHQSSAEMAEALSLPEQDVANYVEALVKEGVEPPRKPRSKLQKAGYDVDLKNGVVAATQQSSTIADEAKGTSPFAPKKAQPKKQSSNPDLVRHDPTR